MVVDPGSRFVNPTDREPMGDVWPLFESGPPSEKVDLLVIGEGVHQGRGLEVSRRRAAAG